MFNHCPGQDIKTLRAAIYLCPSCGAEVEIFSDESAVKCYRCGNMVRTEATPSCVEWCAQASKCLAVRQGHEKEHTS